MDQEIVEQLKRRLFEIVDASIPNKAQNTAIKNLVADAVREYSADIQRSQGVGEFLMNGVRTVGGVAVRVQSDTTYGPLAVSGSQE
jgi:hypothetical protein